jgi:exodeoxyribonuclease VIII
MRIEKDSNDIYHSHDSISASGLKTIAQYGIEYYLTQTHAESEAMKLGTAIHTAILEPDTFFDIYEVMTEKFDLRTKLGKAKKLEFDEKAKGKIVLQKDHYDVVKNLMKRLDTNSLAQKYIKGEKELSHYLEYEGMPVRVRPDVINHVEGFIADIKKTRLTASDKDFTKTVRQFGYHIQAAFYMDMLEVDTFRFIVCEDKAPYTIVVHALCDESIEKGRKAWRDAFKQWKNYKLTGQITSYQPKNVADDGAFLISI